jgi:hypothetical protein
MSPPNAHCARLLAGAFALMIMSSPGAANVVTIGTTADCNYQWTAGGPPVVQQAVAAGATEIRLTHAVQISESITVQGRSIRVSGGYQTCANAANNLPSPPDIRTELRVPFDLARIFSFSNVGANPVDIHLERLALSDPGAGTRQPVDNGGAVYAQGNINLFLQDVHINGTYARVRGGAIHIRDGVSLRTRGHVRITSSHALSAAADDAGGGGIHCRDSTVILGERTLLYFNRALGTGSGGGLHADHCVVRIMSRWLPSQSIEAGFDLNRAGRYGGAVFAANDSKVYLYGGNDCYSGELCLDRSSPAQLYWNIAGDAGSSVGRGGAIFLDNSRLQASQVSIRTNFAHQGGAVAAVNGSQVSFTPTGYFDPDARGRLKDCWSSGRCNDISDNRAGFSSTGGSGGVLFISESDALLAHVRFEDNTADLATIIDIDSASFASIHDSVIVGNGRPDIPETEDLAMFRVFGASSVLQLLHSTVANNAVTFGAVGNDNAGIHIQGSIWHEQPSVNLFPLPQLSTNVGTCNVTSKPLPAGMESQVVADPGFVSVAVGNYRLHADSPAVDLCDHEELDSSLYDFVGQRRNVRLRPGAAHWRDAGAYESLDGERIFANGFFQGYVEYVPVYDF